jgi:cation diffusion facilitator family transporter
VSPLGAARLSLLTGILIFGLKWLAFQATGSVALYSDAIESIVNIVAAGAAMLALAIASRPADANHAFGHTKAEYFSAALEGALVLIAALAIVYEAWGRLRAPVALESLDLGLTLSIVATAINGTLAWYLVRHGRRQRSPALEADGVHIAADVVTTCGVLVGIGLAWATGWWLLDPLLAIAVAINVLWAGGRLVRDSLGALMDAALPPADLARLEQLLAQPRPGMLEAHDLRTRRAGPMTFVQLHLVVEGGMTVAQAHRLCDELEDEIKTLLPGAQPHIHVEPESEAEGAGFGMGGPSPGSG